MDGKDEFKVKSYNTKELAEHYRIAPKVMRRWLMPLKSELGIRIGNYYSTKQVRIIIRHLGKPGR